MKRRRAWAIVLEDLENLRHLSGATGALWLTVDDGQAVGFEVKLANDGTIHLPVTEPGQRTALIWPRDLTPPEDAVYHVDRIKAELTRRGRVKSLTEEDLNP